MIITDSIGQELSAGDFIVYPGRGGSSLWLNFAVIQKVIKDKYHPQLSVVVKSQQWNDDAETKRIVRIIAIGRVTKIDFERVQDDDIKALYWFLQD